MKDSIKDSKQVLQDDGSKLPQPPALERNQALSPDLPAHHIYNIEKWSDDEFGVNDRGHLCLKGGTEFKDIDMMDIIQTIKERGIQTPTVIRFQDILRNKVQELNETFIETIKDYDYQGQFCGVYPIKVNQMREVVEEIVSAGEPYPFGLEAGSKAELLAVLAYNQNRQALSIVNGYKDEEFIRLLPTRTKNGPQYHHRCRKFIRGQSHFKIS